MNQHFIIRSYFKCNISLPSAVPFLPAEHYQFVLILPNRNWPPKRVSEDKDHLITDNAHQKNILFHPKCSCYLANPANSHLCCFFAEYSFLATWSDCSFSTVLQLTPSPLRNKEHIVSPETSLKLFPSDLPLSALLSEGWLLTVSFQRTLKHDLCKAMRLTQLLAIYSCKILVQRAAENRGEP